MINIAIDGPSGSGKSTLAKAVAKKLGICYLDTGAMYRAAGYAALCAGVDISDQAGVKEFIDCIDLRTEYEDGVQIVYVDGENMMPHIRTPEVSKAASDISAHPCVRMKLVAMQREVALHYDVVLDGRDIGTFVLPDATYKFFVIADIEERARRRHAELVQSGIEKTFESVLDEMQKRDAADSSRSLAPLKQADDAILIDTTHMSIEAVADAVLSKINRE